MHKCWPQCKGHTVQDDPDNSKAIVQTYNKYNKVECHMDADVPEPQIRVNPAMYCTQ